jgi:hypothetical protein
MAPGLGNGTFSSKSYHYSPTFFVVESLLAEHLALFKMLIFHVRQWSLFLYRMHFKLLAAIIS